MCYWIQHSWTFLVTNDWCSAILLVFLETRVLCLNFEVLNICWDQKAFYRSLGPFFSSSLSSIWVKDKQVTNYLLWCALLYYCHYFWWWCVAFMHYVLPFLGFQKSFWMRFYGGVGDVEIFGGIKCVWCR